MMFDRRILRILDTLLVLAVLAQVPLVLQVGPYLDQLPWWRPPAFLLAVALVIILWVTWRKRPQMTGLPVALGLSSIAAVVLGDGAAPMALVVFSLLILVLRYGIRPGMVLVAAIVLVGAALMLWVYDRPLEFVLAQLLVMIVLLGLMLLLASLLRLFSEVSVEAQRARDQLAASLETEKEMVLARERARAAGDLHDGLGHRLTAVGFLLDAALQQRHSTPETSWELVREARFATSEALQEMRTWVRALHPLPLEDLSDTQAFRTLADRFQGTDLDIDVDTDVATMTPQQALVVYRCVQEGLTNVVRHSGASRARLLIRQENSAVHVELTDDGQGRGDAGDGFGLAGLRRRVEGLGGNVDSGDLSDGGHRLSVTVPA